MMVIKGFISLPKGTLITSEAVNIQNTHVNSPPDTPSKEKAARESLWRIALLQTGDY